MKNISLADKLKYWLKEPHYPEIGVELNSDSIRMAAISMDGDRIRLEHIDSEALPQGTIEPNAMKANIHSLEIVSEKLRRMWQRSAVRESRICLLLQDRCALTFQVTLEQPPGSRKECLDLIRFKLKKSVPFRIEDAQINYFKPTGENDFGGSSFWAVVMNHSVLHQYEQLINSAIESECGLVDFSTFNLMNLAHTEIKQANLQTQDVLFVNLNRDYISIAITQSGALMFYRNRALERQNGLMEEALAEIHPTAMYYVDKLEGKGLSRAFIYSVEDPAGLARNVQNALSLPAVVISPQGVLQPRHELAGPETLNSYAPLLGLILSRKVEFQ
jgi:type IV pilus assembly protein PilM